MCAVKPSKIIKQLLAVWTQSKHCLCPRIKE
jgi:hypothetical protein